MAYKDWTRREFLIAGSTAALGAALPLACGGGDAAPEKQQTGKVDLAARGTSWAGSRSIFDMADMLHLADVEHYGEFVDFGNASRYKYTNGGWMSGWENDSSMNGVAYTWATTSPSRMYFNLTEQMDVDFQFRVKKGGTESFSVYLNDNPLRRVSMTDKDFATHTVSATADQTVPGENYFKLIYTTSEQMIAGVPSSFAIDYMRIIPRGTVSPKQFNPPHTPKMVQQYKSKDKEYTSVMMACPMTLAYYLEIPANASVCLMGAPTVDAKSKVSPIDFSIRVTPVDGGQSKQMFAKKFEKDEWEEVMVDMAPYAGKLVRIELQAKGAENARFAAGVPALRVKSAPAPRGKNRKNVVVLLVDTLRADKLKSYGNRRVKTNGMDAFVTESVLFENCQSNSNWTKPSCASVLTGLHPDSHKARGHSSTLNKSVKMVSEMFREKGFQTAAFVANGYLATEFGFNRGWNKYVNYIRENKNSDAENVFRDALKFIDDAKDTPFLAYIQTIDPHVPYDPPAEDLKLYDARPYEGPVSPRSTGNLLEEYKRKQVTLNSRDKRHLEALYDGEVTYHDRQFSKFISDLKKRGVLDDTLFVVCADHGEEFFEHESVGHGHTLYQELLHVPLIVRAPGLVPRNARVTAKASLSDIVPTVLDGTGTERPAEVEGRSLIAEANGDTANPFDASFSSFFSEADERNLQWAVRKGDWKLKMKGPVITYLFNLKDDPEEKVDVDERYPLARRAMRIALGQFIGAPDKSKWMNGQIQADVVVKPEAKEEKNENIPEELKEQLRQLGYMK
ncbi:MAG: sulfatase [Deltaproteobacteria bacterium]|nr:sulfatase [Deltaproteobacteria bacterium]